MPNNNNLPGWARRLNELPPRVEENRALGGEIRWDVNFAEVGNIQRWAPIGANPEFAPPPALVAAQAENNSALYDNLLNAVKEIYGVDAMIAGGAVRDFVLGFQCKDVDIFVPLTLADFNQHAAELGWQLGGPRSTKKYKDIGDTERYSARAFGQIIDIVLLGREYNKDPITAFPSFTTRCRYTVADGFFYSPEFLSDVENKTMTISKDVAREKHKQWTDKFKEWCKRNNLKDWTFQIEGVNPNWWRK